MEEGEVEDDEGKPTTLRAERVECGINAVVHTHPKNRRSWTVHFIKKDWYDSSITLGKLMLKQVYFCQQTDAIYQNDSTLNHLRKLIFSMEPSER